MQFVPCFKRLLTLAVVLPQTLKSPYAIRYLLGVGSARVEM